jgi:hypothetical protein
MMEVVMKRFLLPLMLLCAFAVIGSPVSAKKPDSTALLPEDVAAMLQFMREEEKLAHDVYALFNGIYGDETNTFANIMVSEQRHTDAVKTLLQKYGVDDPAANTVPGEFVDGDLQALYNILVSVGQEGLVEALEVGVAIERKDMTDIVEAIELSVAYKDIVRVYSNLLAGSESHLEGFLTALEAAEDE